jgi:hypothetical protein
MLHPLLGLRKKMFQIRLLSIPVLMLRLLLEVSKFYLK